MNQQSSEKLNSIYEKYLTKNIYSTVNCLKTFLQIISKIKENQDDTKFQRIRLSSKILKSTVASIEGGFELFYEVGFQYGVYEFEEFLIWKGNYEYLNLSINWTVAKIEKLKVLIEKKNNVEKKEDVYLENLKITIEKERKQRKQN